MTVDLGSYGEATAPAAGPPSRELRLPGGQRSRRALGVLVAAALVGAADLGVAIARHEAADPGPAATAQRFYDAVRDRDAGTALAQLDLPVGTDRRLLTAAALVQPTGLTQPDVSVVAQHGDSATVAVSYSVIEPPSDGGQTVFAALELHLHRSFGGPLHDRPHWRIVGGLPTVTVLTAGGLTEVTVAGARIRVTGSSEVLPSFPGLVPASTMATPFLSAAMVDLVGSGDSDTTSQRLMPSPSSDAERVGSAAVNSAFLRRSDQLEATQEVSSIGSSFSLTNGGIRLEGSIEQKDAHGNERAWTTEVTVRLVAGRLVASDVAIARAPLPDPGIDPLNGSAG